jgi:phytoene dehydrogenase-like protein/acyl-CoA thioesterase FadM
MKPDALVIGAGIGGLGCAVELARQGLAVQLFEAGPLPGGALRTFRQRGHHFHLSPQYLGALEPGGAMDGILSSFGLRHRLGLQRPELFLTAEFPDLHLQLPNSRAALLDAICAEFPRERTGLGEAFSLIDRLATTLVRSSLLPDRPNQADRSLLESWRGRSFEQLLSEHVVDPRLRAVLGQTWMNMGLPPSQAAAPAAASVFAGGWLGGVNTIIGGGTALVRALEDRLHELGGSCQLNATVARILIRNGAVHGVVLEDGTQVDCPLVVAAIDPGRVFHELIPGPEVSRLYRFRLERMEPSASMYTLHLGLDCPPSQLGIPGSTTFVNPQWDHDESYRRAMEGELEGSAWRLTSYEGSHDECSPAGGGAVVITEVTPSEPWIDLDPAERAPLEEHVLACLIEKAERRWPGLASHAVQRNLSTPSDLAALVRSRWGSAYGAAPVVHQPGRNPLGNRAPVAGLFLAGAWTSTSGGCEATMLGGVQAAVAAMAFAERPRTAPPAALRNATAPSQETAERGSSAGMDHPEEPPEASAQLQHRFGVLVYGCDLNSRGYADAEAYLRFLDRARTEWIEEACALRGVPSWHESHVVNVYRIQARFSTVARVGSQLEVLTGLSRAGSHRAAFHQRIVGPGEDRLLLDARVEVLFLDRQGRMMPVPEGIEGRVPFPSPPLEGGPRALPFSDTDRFPFRSSVRVYFEHTDLQGITFHVSYLRFAERALFDLVRTIWPNLGPREWMERYRVSVCGLDLRFLRATGLGDRLEVWTGVIDVGPRHLSFGQRFLVAGSEELCADLITVVEFRDEHERPVEIPRQAAAIARANLLGAGLSRR